LKQHESILRKATTLSEARSIHLGPRVVGVIGVLLIYEALAHVASAIAPGLAGSSNLFVVLGPILPIVLLVWLGLSVPSRAALLLAVYEAVFVLVLSRTLQRGWLADLAMKP